MKKPSVAVTVGIWAWGTVTALLGAAVVVIILAGEPVAAYTRIKDAATAIGAVVAASALAWSHFFQTGFRQEESAKIEKLDQDVERLSSKIDEVSIEQSAKLGKLTHDLENLLKKIAELPGKVQPGVEQTRSAQ